MRARVVMRAFLVTLLAAYATAYVPAAMGEAEQPASGVAADDGSGAVLRQDPPPEGRRVERLAGTDRVGTAVAVARATYARATVALLASADGYADALVAAPYAADLGAPLLLTPRDRLPEAVADVLADLGVRRVTLLGGPAAISEEVADTLRRTYRVGRVAGADRYGTAARVALLVPASDEVFLATGAGFADGLAVGPLAAAAGAPILLTLPDRLPEVTAQRLAERGPRRVTLVGGSGAIAPEVESSLRADGWQVRRLSGASRHATSVAVADAAIAEGASPAEVWLADGERFPDALAAGPAVAARGGVLLLVDGRRLGAATPVGDWLRARKEALRRIVVLGGPGVMAPDAAAQIEAILAGRQLPRGGRGLLPEHRLVALYGHSSTPALGSMGEQPPEQAADRAVAAAQPYEQGGKPVLPTFEFIATVATAGPGTSGLYRAPTDPAVIQRSLDAIRRVRGYLVLDIQPGRSDFLTESKRYEHFLAQPDVGLALDPEWRMAPDQRPGEAVGSVHASEINAVSAWLADLVARHALPEKLLLLHQFQDRMIRERHMLEPREGLAITVQMDGFGSRSQKLATYARTRTGPPLHNGFKLFYDEDVNLYQPHEVLALDPVPDFVSYQ
ncbi:MAG TPA: cell wall-binding repeat-containing protein [Egibacteraceae bacterium]|nr:cell wall-binding repeat-containing protein [Egibacteraceae bacterium]